MPEEDVEFKLTVSQRMISATVGAMLTSLIVTPLDVVKIRLQAQAETIHSQVRNPAQCPKCTNTSILFSNGLMDHTLPKNIAEQTFGKCIHSGLRFNGTFDALIKIPRYEGIMSLYNGLPPTLLMAIPATVLYFASYDKMKLMLDDYGFDWKLSSLLAGSIARITAATVVSPIEFTRTKMQSMEHPPNMFVTMFNQVRSAGVTSLWRGLSPTLLRDVPFSAMYWVMVETGKRYLIEHWMEYLRDKRVAYFASGLFGGCVAALITHPFDVIKTRRQVFDYSGELNGAQMNTYGIFKRILRDGGPKGLYTGLAPRVSRVAPACAIMLSSYEAGKLFFASRENNNNGFQRIVPVQ